MSYKLFNQPYPLIVPFAANNFPSPPDEDRLGKLSLMNSLAESKKNRHPKQLPYLIFWNI